MSGERERGGSECGVRERGEFVMKGSECAVGSECGLRWRKWGKRGVNGEIGE